MLLLASFQISVAPVAAQVHASADPDRSSWYASGGEGYWSDPSTHIRIDEECRHLDGSEALACSLQAFRDRSFVVVAVVDTGINPYHLEFRAPEFVHHPSSYIDTYPAGAPALELSLDAPDYETAVSQDLAIWQGIEQGGLHWIPGTRIIGAVRASRWPAAPGRPDFAILDGDGHGTAVASVAAGRMLGAHPNALIVAVEGLGDASLRWAASQHWIDVVSNSWGVLGNLPSGSRNDVHDLVDTGKLVLFAAGNGLTGMTGQRLPVTNDRLPDTNPTLTSPYGGVEGVTVVGAASPVNGQSYWWRSIPPDVSSFGSFWPAAQAFSTGGRRNIGGTSCATPIVAGVLAAVLERSRALLGDTSEGPKEKGLAVAGDGRALPGEGPLADGYLTREELETAVLKTSFPVPFDHDRLLDDYTIWPTTPAYFIYQGYGVVDRESSARAMAVVEGSTPVPDRAEVDLWMAALNTARRFAWHRFPEWPGSDPDVS